MKNSPIALIVMIAVPLGAMAEPVAPWPPESALTETGKTLVQYRKGKVPSKEEVGVPIYPGAYLFSTSSGSGLPGIGLLSADPPEKVKAWYEQQLKGWSYDSAMEIFYEGTRKLSLPEIMEGPQIYINPADKEVLGGMYDNPVKTSISITYRPNK